MSGGRWYAGATGAIAIAFALTACGGGAKKAAPAPNSDQGQITSAYETFFAGWTSVQQKVNALESGPRYKPYISKLSASEVAKKASVKVSSVDVHQGTATVRYTILESGLPALPPRNGNAVRVGGRWKVGALTFCQLLGANGNKPPPVCKAR